MKLYAGRFLRSSVTKALDSRVESRDAEVYDVDLIARKCRVKIQGTAALIVAYYPENWESVPSWLKPGNSVRISHTGGHRGRIELVGHGSSVISPVAGDIGKAAISSSTALLSGFSVMQTSIPSRSCVLTVGTFRYNGATYTIPPIKMTSGSGFKMGFGGKMGQVASVFTMTGYPSDFGAYSYYCFDVGSDLVVNTTSSTASRTPAIPTLSADHVRGGWVLIDGGFQNLYRNLTSAEINKVWSPIVVANIAMSVADADLAWGENSTTITITVQDQNGSPLQPTAAAPWCIKIEFAQGSGQLTAPDGTITSLPTTFYVTGYATTATVTFAYTRDNPATNKSPIFKATLMGYGISAVASMLLYDIDGNVM